MDIKVFDICEYDMVAATSEEDAKKWYELNFDKLDDGDITELDIDKNGMWYPTKEPKDMERIKKRENANILQHNLMILCGLKDLYINSHLIEK
ncbi:hypothetical protein BXY41_103251 [Lacrimispora xylanisolvens]|uniref:Uncharacterized protein n=1 Tax=Lacrimispora xylanisolvens TaxID=384636 RepID=A0A2S6HVS2_9FIRM|nr:hypothetical protein [Hungatella xylanolytica]PPK82039.1 hypothetical protein BXY41_103251 [Hungatella xylanolytica]